jgi:iron(III) transport system substrate-binding protein
MKKNIRLSVLGILLLISIIAFTGCSTPSQKSNPESYEEKTKSESSQKESDPAENKPSKEEEWEKIVAEAQKEGKVVISGSPSKIWREALVEPFEEKYPEIKVVYSGDRGSDFYPKVIKEREVGKYEWDIRVGGANPTVYKSKNNGVLEPIIDFLNDDILDDSKWQGGLSGLFIDKEDKFIPGFLAYSSTLAHVNRDFIPEGELTSPEELLDSKYKGKIVMLDPRGGSGLGNLAVMLEGYGEDFVRQLLTKQEIVVTKDTRQMAEWVVRGKYPIGIGVEEVSLHDFTEKGVGKNVKQIEKGVLPLSTGYGALQLFTNAPNPNAAKVYINWALSPEGQKEITHRVELNSKRLDIEPGNQGLIVDRKQIDRYVPHQNEEYVDTRRKAQAIADELIK